MASGSHPVTQPEVRDTTEALIFLRVTLRDTDLSCMEVAKKSWGSNLRAASPNTDRYLSV